MEYLQCDNDKILRCLCSCVQVQLRTELFEGRPAQCWQVQCCACGTAGAATITKQGAIDAWNFIQRGARLERRRRVVEEGEK